MSDMIVLGTNALGGVRVSIGGVEQTIPPTYAALQGTPYYKPPTDTSGATYQTVQALQTISSNYNPATSVIAYSGSGQTTIATPQGSYTINKEIAAGSDILQAAINTMQDKENQLLNNQAALSAKATPTILNDGLTIPLNKEFGLKFSGTELLLIGGLALLFLIK